MATLTQTIRGAFTKPSPEPTRNPASPLPVGEVLPLGELEARLRWLEIEDDGLSGSGWDGDIIAAAARHGRQSFAADVESILSGNGLDAASTAVDDIRRERRALTGAIVRLRAANDIAAADDINRRSAEVTALLRPAVARAMAGSVADLPRHAEELRQYTDSLVHLLRSRGLLIRPEALVALPPFDHDAALETAAMSLLTAAEWVSEAAKAYAPPTSVNGIIK